MRKNPLFFLFTIFFLIACQISEEERIQQILNRRQEALQKKDLALYLSCISKSYQDKDEDFSRLQNRMEGYFKTFDRIEYSSWDRSIQIEGDQARVTQQFFLRVEKAGKENRYSGKEGLFLRKEGKGWKIIKGF
jgi:ketosteroid isomerase-like protein